MAISVCDFKHRYMMMQSCIIYLKSVIGAEFEQKWIMDCADPAYDCTIRGIGNVRKLLVCKPELYCSKHSGSFLGEED